MPIAPDLPTIAEAGLPFAIEVVGDAGGSAGTPAPIVQRINAELRAVLALPDIQKQLNDRGQIPVVSPPPQELEAFVKTRCSAGATSCARQGRRARCSYSVASIILRNSGVTFGSMPNQAFQAGGA